MCLVATQGLWKSPVEHLAKIVSSVIWFGKLYMLNRQYKYPASFALGDLKKSNRFTQKQLVPSNLILSFHRSVIVSFLTYLPRQKPKTTLHTSLVIASRGKCLKL